MNELTLIEPEGGQPETDAERVARARKHYGEAHAALMYQATITETEAHRVLDAIKQRFVPHVGWLA